MRRPPRPLNAIHRAIDRACRSHSFPREPALRKRVESLLKDDISIGRTTTTIPCGSKAWFLNGQQHLARVRPVTKPVCYILRMLNERHLPVLDCAGDSRSHIVNNIAGKHFMEIHFSHSTDVLCMVRFLQPEKNSILVRRGRLMFHKPIEIIKSKTWTIRGLVPTIDIPGSTRINSSSHTRSSWNG